MSKEDYGAEFCRYYDGRPYIDLSVPGAVGAIPVEEARHLHELLTKALVTADDEALLTRAYGLSWGWGTDSTEHPPSSTQQEQE